MLRSPCDHTIIKTMNNSLDPRLRRHRLGFLQLKQIPSTGELREYYADKYYQANRGSYRNQYSTLEREFVNLKIERRATCAALYTPSRDRETVPRLLDVGCGEGFALSWYKQRGWNVEGIDFSRNGVETHNPSVLDYFIEGDVFESLEQRIKEGRTYDVVWLQNVLEHVVDPVRLLESLQHIVESPGGILVLTVPNDGSRFQQLLMEEELTTEPFWIAVPDHISYFDRDSLQRTAIETGWKCKDVLADFPIDWYLLHPGSNYVHNRENGPAAHQARMKMEKLIHSDSPDMGISLYRELSATGLGRNLTAVLVRE